MMQRGVELRGLERAIRKLESALFQEATKIMTDSKENFVPVDLGTLRESGTVLPPERSGSTVSVQMGYGGFAESYALIQHENLEFRHPNGGGPKYLERPFNAAVYAPGFRARISEYVARALK